MKCYVSIQGLLKSRPMSQLGRSNVLQLWECILPKEQIMFGVNQICATGKSAARCSDQGHLTPPPSQSQSGNTGSAKYHTDMLIHLHYSNLLHCQRPACNCQHVYKWRVISWARSVKKKSNGLFLETSWKHIGLDNFQPVPELWTQARHSIFIRRGAAWFRLRGRQLSPSRPHLTFRWQQPVSRCCCCC